MSIIQHHRLRTLSVLINNEFVSFVNCIQKNSFLITIAHCRGKNVPSHLRLSKAEMTVIDRLCKIVELHSGKTIVCKVVELHSGKAIVCH